MQKDTDTKRNTGMKSLMKGKSKHPNLIEERNAKCPIFTV